MIFPSEYQALKQKSKFKIRKKQEDRAYEELLRKKERIRKAREKQLKAELSIKRKEKEDEKAKKEEKRKKTIQMRKERRERKAQEKKEYFEENKRKIKEWKMSKLSEEEQLEAEKKEKEKADKVQRDHDFAAAQKRRDHLNAERVQRIKKEAKEFGIKFEEENLETYGVTIKNIDQVEREIKVQKKIQREKNARSERNDEYNKKREEVQKQMKDREDYEKRTMKDLESKLNDMNLTPTEFVVEMLKVRLGIGGPERTDHRAMRLHDLFGKMDDDTSGSISKEEMKNAFKEMKINLDDPLFDEFFSDFDPNGDGSLDYEEFLTQMRTHIHGGQGVVKRTSTMKKEKKAQKNDDDEVVSDDGSNDGFANAPPPPPKKKEEVVDSDDED